MFGCGENVKETCHHRFEGLPLLVLRRPRTDPFAEQETKHREDQPGADNRACKSDIKPLHTVGKPAEGYGCRETCARREGYDDCEIGIGGRESTSKLFADLRCQ